MPLEDGFRAVAGGAALDSRALHGFGTQIERALKQNLGDEVEVEYAISKDLKPRFSACDLCQGTERVEIEGTVAGQWLADEFSTIDWSKRATGTCPRCKGLGVHIGFLTAGSDGLTFFHSADRGPSSPAARCEASRKTRRGSAGPANGRESAAVKS